MCNKCYTIGDEVKDLEGKPCRVPDAKDPVLPEAENEGASSKDAMKGKTNALEPRQETPESKETPSESKPSRAEEAAKLRERALREIRMAQKEIKRLELLKMIETEREQLQRLMAAKMQSTLVNVLRGSLSLRQAETSTWSRLCPFILRRFLTMSRWRREHEHFVIFDVPIMSCWLQRVRDATAGEEECHLQRDCWDEFGGISPPSPGQDLHHGGGGGR